MAILISAVLFLALTVAIAYFGYRRYARPGSIFEQLGGKATITMPVLGTVEDEEGGLLVSLIQQIGEKVPINPEDASLLRHDLMMAGYQSAAALPMYQAGRVALKTLSSIIRTNPRSFTSGEISAAFRIKFGSATAADTE